MGDLSGLLGGLMGPGNAIAAAIGGLGAYPPGAPILISTPIPWLDPGRSNPAEDVESADFDKAQWDRQFERECGYLPEGSPIAKWREYMEQVSANQRVLMNAAQAAQQAIPYVAFEEVLGPDL